MGLMTLKNCAKFGSNTRNDYLEKLENINLHANLNLGIF